MNITVQEGIKVLSLICQNSIKFSDSVDIKLIPEPSNQAKDLMNVLNIKLPKTIKEVEVPVVTRHKTKKLDK